MNSIIKITPGIFYVIIAVLNTLYTLYTVVDLMLFLSNPNYNKIAVTKESKGTNVTWNLLVNMFLLTLFIIQHSFMALAETKKILKSLKLTVLQRNIYVVCSSFALKFLINNWRVIPEISLWVFDINNKLVWWSFLMPHILAWIIIYVGAICMDINELLGLKQVYYSIRNLPDPLTFKSIELKNLYLHMRHPSFTAFTVLLWVTPIMSLDRLLLATILTSYMYLAWNTDNLDYKYLEKQYASKFSKFNYVQ